MKYFCKNLLFAAILLIAACVPKTDVISDTSGTFLWKIEKTGQPESYLLGTIHMNRIGYELPDSVREAMEKTDVLFTETNMTPGADELRAMMAQMYSPEPDLPYILEEPLFNELAKYLSGSISSDILAYMKPWAAAVFVATVNPEGYSADYGVDMLVTLEAGRFGHKKMFLEGLMEGMEFFMVIPDEELVGIIRHYLYNIEEIKALTAELVNLYNSGDAGRMVQLAYDMDYSQASGDKEFWLSWMYDLTIARNKKWMKALEPMLQKEACFFAVGALHLFEEEGIIDLLAKQGYIVSPVY